jgi:hypothetical protein
MPQQEQLLCTCDRCDKFVTVKKKTENGYFEKPSAWKEWSDRDGTIILLCPECDKALREFVRVAPESVPMLAC